MTKFLRCFPLIVLAVLAGCGGGSIPTTSSNSHPAVVLQSIRVSASNPSLTAGTTGQLTAMGSYSDGSSQDLTKSATWSSSNPSVATVNGNGLAKGMAQGACTVTATQATVSGATTLTVAAPPLVSIAVTAASPSIGAGSTDQFTATGTYSDGSTQNITGSVTWSVSNSAIATIASNGLATGTANGSATITATSGSISGTASLTVTIALVSISVSPAVPTIAIGTDQQFKATGTFTDGSTQDVTSTVNWVSAKTTIANVSNTVPTKGLAQAVAAGSSVITASSGSISASATLTVSSGTLTSIAVTPANSTVPIGLIQQLTATGTFSDGTTQDITNTVTWSTSPNTVASITVSGAATALKSGKATITATSGGVSGNTQMTVNTGNLVSITIKQGNVTLAQGTSTTLTAVGLFNDGSTRDISNQVTWSSSNPGFATIQSTGRAQSVSPGLTTITAALGVQSASVSLTVTNATIVSISVAPSITSIALGTQLSFAATGLFSDSSTQTITSNVTWTSSDTTVATMSTSGAKGIVTAVGTGPVTINATFGATTGSAQLNVTSAALTSISLTPATSTLAPASTIQWTAVGTFSDGTTQNLSTIAHWTSSSSSVATVTSYGAVTGQSAGIAVITASLQGISGTANIVVESAALTSISVLPSNPTVPESISTSLSAIGVFGGDPNNTQDLTSAVSWTSSAASVATVSNAGGTKGDATGVAPGSSTITALFAAPGGATTVGTTTLQVTNATLNALAVLPSSASITLGSPQGFAVKGIFSDGSVIDLSTQATWTSSNVNVAVINSQGLASSVSSGTTTITASLNGVTGTAVLTVQ